MLAYVTPPMQAIDVSDMRQKQGELDQQISIVQRRLCAPGIARRLGAVARTQVEDTRLELEGLSDRRSRARHHAPRTGAADRAGVGGDRRGHADHRADRAEQCRGVSHRHPGPALDRGPELRRGRRFRPRFRQDRQRHAAELIFRGSGLADRSQSIPVHFAVDGDATGLRAGQFVTVFTETGEERTGIAVPRTAVVRTANGQDFVFEHTGAERFEPRPVRIEPLDAERVLIAAGIDPGKRVVVQGAELLDHVR